MLAMFLYFNPTDFYLPLGWKDASNVHVAQRMHSHLRKQKCWQGCPVRTASGITYSWESLISPTQGILLNLPKNHCANEYKTHHRCNMQQGMKEISYEIETFLLKLKHASNIVFHRSLKCMSDLNAKHGRACATIYNLLLHIFCILKEIKLITTLLYCVTNKIVCQSDSFNFISNLRYT